MAANVEVGTSYGTYVLCEKTGNDRQGHVTGRFQCQCGAGLEARLSDVKRGKKVCPNGCRVRLRIGVNQKSKQIWGAEIDGDIARTFGTEDEAVAFRDGFNIGMHIHR